ncbi:MAG: hypothetical protein GF353_01780 [Candidatus Lokiarchaeota archaeon]|nr:hypothetical protein [Candidatus Lokiarchaeota archaeon]
MKFVYDFGDNWELQVTLEEIRQEKKKLKHQKSSLNPAKRLTSIPTGMMKNGNLRNDRITLNPRLAILHFVNMILVDL